MIYIGIVDDKQSISKTLEEQLNALAGYRIVFTAKHGKHFLEQMAEARKSVEPDIVLMDLDMPVMNGIDAIREAKLRYTKTRYLVLTIFDEDEKIFNAIKAGADGYLLKDESIETIKTAIDNLMINEGAPMSPSIARKVLQLLSNPPKAASPVTNKESENEYNLTDRETQILKLLIDGLEYKEIAQDLGISPNTVRNSITKIYGKLHVNSRMQAARLMQKR